VFFLDGIDRNPVKLKIQTHELLSICDLIHLEGFKHWIVDDILKSSHANAVFCLFFIH
jgi:hypothetical protein